MKMMRLIGMITLLVWVGVQPIYADTITLTTCDFDSLLNGITSISEENSRDGGTITFDCSGTIVFENSIELTFPLTINGGGEVIFDGNGENPFFLIWRPAHLTVDGITFQNGYNVAGGALVNNWRLTVQNSIFTNNVGEFGAVIYNNALLVVNDSKFLQNSAVNAIDQSAGGAILGNFYSETLISRSSFIENSANYGGAITNYGELTLTDSDVFDNEATVSGAGIYNGLEASLSIIDSTLSGNSADYGAVIYNDGNTFLVRSTFSENEAQAFGGVIQNNNGGQVRVEGSLFAQNSASFAGAINNAEGTFIINTTTFYKNSTFNQAGAIHNNDEVAVTNSTFIENRASDRGGAIYSFGRDTTMTITHSSFINNADSGAAGAIYGYGTVTMTYSLLVGGGIQCSGLSEIVADESNLATTICGEARVVDDLLLGEFDGMMVPLLPNSPAIDAYDAPCAVSIDQINRARPQGAGCDVGAVEMP